MLLLSTRKNNEGFTLLEVLVAFSILSVLLTVIIQSQAETAFFLHKTGKLQLVQREVINRLAEVERICSSATVPPESGYFPGEHELSGDSWQLVVSNESFMGMIHFTKITYRISWVNPKGSSENSFESAIFCGR